MINEVWKKLCNFTERYKISKLGDKSHPQIERVNTVKMQVFSKLFYRFNLIPNEIPTSVIVSHRPQQIDSKIYAKKQRSKTQENTEEKSETIQVQTNW